jgi:hypothetical protein
MMRRRIKVCRICGSQHEVSRRLLCRRCADRRVRESVEQLKKRRGEIYELWRRRLADSMSSLR